MHRRQHVLHRSSLTVHHFSFFLSAFNYVGIRQVGKPLRDLPPRLGETRLHGFTLVELLVVIAIIGVLVSMLMPAVMHSRTNAQRIQCQSQLRQVGLALENYMNALGSHAKYPNAAVQPSVTPTLPSLTTVLGKFIEENQAALQCPADQKYFPTEGLSYEYANSTLANKTRAQVLLTAQGQELKPSVVQAAYDFDDFHGPTGSPTARNILFLDCHVE